MNRYQPRHSSTRRVAAYLPRHAGPVGHRPRAVLWAVAAIWTVALAGVATSLAADRGESASASTSASTTGAAGAGAGQGAAGAGAGQGEDGAGEADVPVVERPLRPDNAPGPTELAPSPPQYVEIPTIGVRSELEALELGEDGALQAPSAYDVAGWFAAGTEPGQPGPAVVAGHVDSTEGPAVFYELEQLAAGDEVLVGREDGQVIRFVVTEVQRHPKDEFPADSVYGPVPGADLRLITCDGPFDRSNGSYRDNLIVFASAAGRPRLG